MEVDFVSLLKVEETTVGGEESEETDECVCSNCSICETNANLRREIDSSKETVESLQMESKELTDLLEEKRSIIENSRLRNKDIANKIKHLSVKYASMKEENRKLEQQMDELIEILKNREICVDYHTKQLNKVRADFSIINQTVVEKFLANPQNPPKIVSLESASNQLTSRTGKKSIRSSSKQVSIRRASKYKSCTTQTNVLQCPICCKVCRNATGLAHHQRFHLRKQKKESVRKGSGFNSVDYQESQELQSRKLLLSEIDDTNFDCQEDMKKNQQDHRKYAGIKNKKCFQCILCDKTFFSPAQLREHENTHTGKKPFACEVCSKSFSYRASAYTHSLTHSKFKAFQCSKCKYSFTQRAHLRRHMLVHQRNRSHKCDLCGASFARLYLLKIHNRRIHSQQVRPIV